MKNRLRATEDKYKKGGLKKEAYIKKMHKLHGKLWDYSEFVRGKNIDSIKIGQGLVILKTRSGIKLFCDPADERSSAIEILNFGDYEAKELSMIQKFIKRDSIILDVGANVGWYSLSLSRVASRGRILAFEPAPETYKRLKANIAINSADNITPYNFGFSNKAGKFSLYYNPKRSGSTSLKKLLGTRGIKTVKCSLKTLDGFASDFPALKIDLIKCDVEGAEKLVIEGGIETIKKNLPVIFLELLRKWSAKFNYRPNEVIRIMKDIGYKCYFANNLRLVEIKKMTDRTNETNFFFLHPKRHENFINKFKRT